ncbi:MAG: polysaccharide deacetylase, partial [Clostridiaceae bacterium]|nr:polysaccharide deacetylase [Clostridiaceae bacterium]
MMKRHKKILFLTAIIPITLGGNALITEYQESKVLSAFENNPLDCDNYKTDKSTTMENTYLSLEDDPNAEDALKVYKITEKLITGEIHYPVRQDGKKVVYLTFDDGPSIENTDNILKILDKYNVKATFFLTGISINKGDYEKELVKKIAYSGHAIGNHSYSHSYKKLYPNRHVDAEAFIDDMEHNNDLLKSILGPNFSTRAIRFPGGYWSWGNRAEIKKDIDTEGYAIIDWNSLNEDAQGCKKYAPELVMKTKENVKKLGNNADSIVFLMHDANDKQETV